MVTKITQEMKTQIEKKIEKIKEDLVELREEKKRAYDLSGDTWHDNPYFNKLEQDERVLQNELASVVDILMSAEIIENEERNLETVEIGSIFKCSSLYDGEEEEEETVFEIVPHETSGMASGALSSSSVVAQNLMGLKINEEIEFETLGGKAKYKILKFYKSWDDVKNEKQ